MEERKKEEGRNFLSQMKCRGWGAVPAPRGAPWLLEGSTGIGHLPPPLSPLLCPHVPAAPTLLPGQQEPGVFIGDPAGIQFKQYTHLICLVKQHCHLLSNQSGRNSCPASNISPLKSQWLLVFPTFVGIERSQLLKALQMVPEHSNLIFGWHLFPCSVFQQFNFHKNCCVLASLRYQDRLGSDFNRLNFAGAKILGQKEQDIHLM